MDRTRTATAVGLFVALVVVYWMSIPSEFNTIYENRRFFDSDGEFITRQFRQGSTFTHNDHLLYHVTARTIVSAGDGMGVGPVDIVHVHKWMSVLAGAAAAALAFVIGQAFTGRWVGALGAAALFAGSAGWWFFSATIDTYMPNVFASVVAIGAMLRCAVRQRTEDYWWLGIAIGLACLFRTDGILLLCLAGVVFAGPRPQMFPGLVRLAAGLAMCGVLYVLIAHVVYGVPLVSVVSWALGHAARPEANHMWGVVANVTPANLWLVALNHLLYVVFLPGLLGTRAMSVLAVGLPALIVAFASAVAVALALFRQRDWPTTRWVVAMAVTWLVTRIVFYTWWNPNEPFLFAVMSVPALWLLTLAALGIRPNGSAHSGGSVALVRVFDVLIWVAAAAVWLHNLRALVLPVRAL